MPKISSATKGTTYVGIDPGLTGGITVVQDDGQVREVFPMPSSERDLHTLLINVSHRSINSSIKAALENVSAMQGWGTSSTFKFGLNLGMIRMGLVAAHIPFELVRPAVWLSGLRIPGKTNKEKKDTRLWKKRLRAKAQELFPSIELWTRKQNEQLAVADSVLIAEYYRRASEGKLV